MRSTRGSPAVLVLADDLSGALEVGAKFAAAGIAAAVTIGTRHPLDVGVLVIDTETRHLTAAEAGSVVRRLAGVSRGARLIYKKTDSTLRGNIAAELGELARAFPGSGVLYVPAYPKMGRTVRGGELLVNGVPVGETEFARDPLEPVRDSRVPSAPGVEIRDASTDVEIGEIAEEFLRGDGILLAAGPAAFAEAIARRIDVPRASPPVFPRVRRCLVVNGSLHSQSARQIAAFRGAAGWVVADSRQATMVRERLKNGDFEAAVVFGGDTAYEIVEALGSPLLRPFGEIVEGVAMSGLRFAGREFFLITKAGGFGPVEILNSICERL